MRTCWFTGGTGRYICVSRTDEDVTFSPTYYEADGIHKVAKETFPIKTNRDGIEYVVVQSYRGEENRMYAANPETF